MAYLEIRNFTKCYQDCEDRRAVLENTSLKVERGQIIALLGRSGSGKTTLLNLISGIDNADQGEILLEGRSLTGMDDLERTLQRRCCMGFIFQFFNLVPTLTIWENVTLPLELNGIMDDSNRQRAKSLLEAVGLADRLNDFPDRLSGGEQQRIAICRALVHDPQLILADEPTGNLDEKTGGSVMDLLVSLVREGGKNLILVTHSAETAACADRIFTLTGGQLVEQGRNQG
jgi:putative ABC transport system ATP-binding protein